MTSIKPFAVGDRVVYKPELVVGKSYGGPGGGRIRFLTAMANRRANNTVLTVLSADAHIVRLSDHMGVTKEMLDYYEPLPEGHIGLPRGSYKPFEIPRKKKAPRKIVAPDPKLLKYQQSKLKDLAHQFYSLEKTYNITGIMNGFVPNRNCVTAARRHIGYDLTIMMDIVAFFDSVTTEHTQIADPNFYTIEKYCGQGFATSPMLANIGIIPIVASIDQYLKEKFNDNYAFSIYADDIQISINSSDFIPDTDEIIEIVTAAFNYYNFEIHPHKTRIRHAKHGYRRILGINVGSNDIRATRKTMRKLRAAKHQANGPSAGGLTTWSKCLLPKVLRFRDPYTK